MNKVKKTALAVSVTGILAIAGFEGFVGDAYQPLPGDKWTIGFGHTEGVTPGDKMSPGEALSILRKDTASAQRAVNKLVQVPMSQNEFDALVSLVYNIGETQFRSSTLLKCVNAGDYECVSRQWMRWKYFKGEPIKGLENRRAKELYIYSGGEVRKSADGSICFGPHGCVSSYDFLQERTSGPDKAKEY